MVDRIQIVVPQAVLDLDGQPQIVLSGTILDVDKAEKYTGAAIKLVETPGTLTNNKPTSVRGVRTR
jgi:hypothetical protein